MDRNHANTVGRLPENASGPNGRPTRNSSSIEFVSIRTVLKSNTERRLVGDSSVELRKLNQTLQEINKTLTRQNAILDKILRWQILDHKESTPGDGGAEAGENAGGGETDRNAGVGIRPGTAEVQPRTPTPQDIAQANAAKRFIEKIERST